MDTALWIRDIWFENMTTKSIKQTTNLMILREILRTEIRDEHEEKGTWSW